MTKSCLLSHLLMMKMVQLSSNHLRATTTNKGKLVAPLNGVVLADGVERQRYDNWNISYAPLSCFFCSSYHSFLWYLRCLSLEFVAYGIFRAGTRRWGRFSLLYSSVLFAIAFTRCGARAARVRSCRTAMNAVAFISFLIHAAKQA